jgi:CRP-like cAMP-binding protein
MGITEKTFNSGEIIINAGDIGRSFFRLVEGSAVVCAGYGQKDQLEVAVIEAGEYFGEMAIIDEYPRSATVLAKGTVRVIEIPDDEMNEYFSFNPDQIIVLINHLGNRVRTTTVEYNEAKTLLTKLQSSDSARKDTSLIARIKNHLDLHHSNRVIPTEPSIAAVRKAFENVTGATSGKLESYMKGDVIFKEGQAGNSMYILHDGKVVLYGNYGQADELMKSDLVPFSFFGETGFSADEPRIVTAVAEADYTCIERISPDDLELMFRSSPERIDMILRYLSYRLRMLTIDFFNTCRQLTDICGK